VKHKTDGIKADNLEQALRQVMQQAVQPVVQGDSVGYFQQRLVALLSGSTRRGLGDSWHTATVCRLAANLCRKPFS
jgi:hypothetical protein